jgi:predicted dehydrogenase
MREGGRMINIGIIGCGHWGPNHIRNFNSLKDSRVLMCADLEKRRLAAIKDSFGNVEVTNNYFDILKNKEINAVIIATPTKTHYKITKESLEHNKDVLCEKPLATSVAEAKELVGLAKRKKRILMVGHVFMYNAGIQKLKEYVDKGTLGRIYYICAKRTNLGPIRNDVNAVWDLASHDISIFLYLLNSQPLKVSACGEAFLHKELEDIAFISLRYPKKILGNIHVSWLDPRKIREITIVGDKKMAVWDDLNITEPIRLYDKGVMREPYYDSFDEFRLIPKEGDITIPRLPFSEPLKNQGIHFLECVKKRKSPLSDGNNGLAVVKTLNAVITSLKTNGRAIKSYTQRQK